MKKSILFLIWGFLFYPLLFVSAQEKIIKNDDAILKETLFNANKSKIINYSLKQFDELFFEFFEKRANPDLILTKEEFYGYTVKIAIFSDRLAKLYPKEKELAKKNKDKWLAESYEDYLLTKQTIK